MYIYSDLLTSPLKVDDEIDGLKQDGILGIGVLDLLTLGGFLGSI